MAKFSRDKGKRGERLAAKCLQQVFPDAARDLNDVYAEKGIDLTNTGRLAVQVKHYQNHAPITKMREIVFTNGQIPVLISWPTNKIDAPVVVLLLDDFIDILKDKDIVHD